MYFTGGLPAGSDIGLSIVLIEPFYSISDDLSMIFYPVRVGLQGGSKRSVLFSECRGF
jgi:hypothetical protein